MSLYQHTNYRYRKFDSLSQALENKEFKNILKYSKQIKRYINNFSKKNIKIIIFEDFKKNNLKIYKEICEFLEIDENFKPDISKRNIRKTIRKNFISKLILKLPLYKMYKFVEKNFSIKIKNIILKIGNKIVFKSEKWNIDEKYKKELMKRFKPEVIKINKLLHKENLIDKDKNLIKYWGYDKI